MDGELQTIALMVSNAKGNGIKVIPFPQGRDPIRFR